MNSELRWKNNNIINSLGTEIGVDSSNKIIKLDLHEKNHGPHGLIAGMTGSGKSEFIVTYILSLAVNYSPEEVQFVLIDYKGGGLAGAFENRKTGIKLPHLAGTITNLDKAEMNRTLVSIQSELQRRQKVFNEAKIKLNTGTIDIYKYQRLHREGLLDDPISHLFIICDEFAELKSQQPDFMDQLVSAARIGRSLGVHLILATQKPSGVVDDQIWSNAKFKVCCKVQTAEDSNEMIRRPDAAYLKEAGRFYLQVGYDQYFIMGQSAYSGVKYVPSTHTNVNIDNSIDFINYQGNVIKNVFIRDDSEKTEDLGEELGNVLKYIIGVAKSLNLSSKQLWLDNIPNNIYYSYVISKYKNNLSIERNIIKAIIGEYDDPQTQSQGYAYVDLSNGGNLLIGGNTGSGKTTLLSTIIYSIIINHSPDEVNFYIIDYANENLKKFMNAPQVSDVITQDSASKVNILFKRINEEIKRRKEILSNVGLDYNSYVQKNVTHNIPFIIVILNGLDNFKDYFEDIVSNDIPSISRECAKYGITLIFSEVATNAISYSVLENFPQKIALNYTEKDNYYYLMNSKLVPSENPGRGLINIKNNVYQFQVCQIFEVDKLNENLNYVFDCLNKSFVSVPCIPDVPDTVFIKDLISDNMSLNSIPIGVDINTMFTSYYNFENYLNFLLADNDNLIKKFVINLTKVLSRVSKTRTIILDGTSTKKIISSQNVKYYDSDFDKLIGFLHSNIDKYRNMDNYDERMVIFIMNYPEIELYLMKKKEKDSSVYTLNDLILASKDLKIFKFVICSSQCYASDFYDYDWYDLYKGKNGICLGECFNSQDIILAKKSPNEYTIELNSSLAVIVNESDKKITKFFTE